MELANTTSSVKGSTKRGTIVQARTASPSTLEAFTLFLNGKACCGSKPARWRCRVFFTKEWMRYEITEEQARQDSTLEPPSASAGQLKNIDAPPPARKAHAHQIHEVTGRISNTSELPWPVWAMRRRGFPQSRCGGEPPRCAASNNPNARHNGCC